jgi:hypothetical protein
MNGLEKNSKSFSKDKHAVSPVFAKECKDFLDAPPSAVRTVFSPRSRFEIPCNTNHLSERQKEFLF